MLVELIIKTDGYRRLNYLFLVQSSSLIMLIARVVRFKVFKITDQYFKSHRSSQKRTRKINQLKTYKVRINIISKEEKLRSARDNLKLIVY